MKELDLTSPIHRLTKSKFVRNVAIVASGTAAAQAIGMAFTPIITRLYGPEAFGVLGTFMALAAVLTPVAALTYPIAIVLPKDDKDAKGLARLSLFIAFGFALLMAIMLLFTKDHIINLLNLEEISPFVWLIPPLIIFAAWFQINQQWIVRKKQFKIYARIAIVQSVLINSTKTFVGLFKPIAPALIVIYTLGSALHAFLLFLSSKKIKEGFTQERNVEATPSTWILAKKYYDFPLFRAPQTLLNALSQSIPVLFLSAFWGPAAAGFYVIGKKVLNMPTSLISQAVGKVLYPKFVEKNERRIKLNPLINKACLGLMAVGIVPFGLVIVFGPLLFGFIFGDEWSKAGEYARWLSMLSFAAFVSRPCIEAIPVIKMQGILLFIEILTVIFTVVSFILGYYLLKNDVGTIALFSITFVLRYIIIYILVLYRADRSVFSDGFK